MATSLQYEYRHYQPADQRDRRVVVKPARGLGVLLHYGRNHRTRCANPVRMNEYRRKKRFMAVLERHGLC